MDRPIEWTADWRQNWAALDRFLRDWLGIAWRRNADERRTTELERLLGRQLPPSAREWCYFAWSAEQLGRLFSFRDCFVVEQLKEHAAVALLLQGEGDFYWAIEEHLLADDDPPVTAYLLDYESEEQRFNVYGQWSPSVSAFACDYLLTYLHAPGGGAGMNKSLAGFDRDALAKDFGPPTTAGHLEIFGDSNVIVFTSFYVDNWHYDSVRIQLRHKTPARSLPPSIQRMLEHAYLFEGPLATGR